MSGVKIVTIKEKLPLWKKEEPATNIELITFEENDFKVVSQKDLYQVGDYAVYCFPDYNVPDNSLFESFLRPNGDSSKTKLGKLGRIRSIKFNFHTGNGKTIYSEGILLPFDEVDTFLGGYLTNFIDDPESNLDECLGITKYEGEIQTHGLRVGAKSKSLPEGLYKTDEDNIKNLWNYLQFPVKLIGTLKYDGSSITIYSKNEKTLTIEEIKEGVCSRSIDLPLTEKIKVGQKKGLWNWIISKFGIDTGIYEEVQSQNIFVQTAMPYLLRLTNLVINTRKSMAIRGEIIGRTMKGSGNSNNPHINSPTEIYWYDVNNFEKRAEPVNFSEFNYYLNTLSDSVVKFKPVEVLFNQTFTSKEELEERCEGIFNERKIEGIVIRTEDRNFSAKLMNQVYDANK